MPDQFEVNEAGPIDPLGCQHPSGRPSASPDIDPHNDSSVSLNRTSESLNSQVARGTEQSLEGRSELEIICYMLHDCFPEDMDLTRPVVKQFITHRLLTTVIFERVP